MSFNFYVQSTPLYNAVATKDKAELITILSQGGNVDEPDTLGNTALSMAVLQAIHTAEDYRSDIDLSIIHILLRYSADPNFCNNENVNYSAMKIAIAHPVGSCSTVKT